MDSRRLFDDGQISTAVAAALGEVKSRPTDIPRRWFLGELLCFAGDWERADRQLETLGQQDPGLAINVNLFRQLVRAEMSRREVFNQGRVPEFVQKPTPALEQHLKACVCLREGDPQAALAILSAAEEERTPISGKCDGEAFDDLRDLDDLLGPILEVHTGAGSYFWIPFEEVELLSLRTPGRARDLLWRPAHIDLRNGVQLEAFLPMLYPLTDESNNEQLKLGRSTDWTEADAGPVRGIGLRMFLIGDHDKTMMELGEIEFIQHA